MSDAEPMGCHPSLLVRAATEAGLLKASCCGSVLLPRNSCRAHRAWGAAILCFVVGEAVTHACTIIFVAWRPRHSFPASSF